jgi:transposase
VDRASLEQLLGRGLSLAEIGRRFGLHESTVGYWVERYELDAAHGARHARRGGLPRERLEQLVVQELSIAAIADATDRSKATVRYWLRRYGLKTLGQAGRDGGDTKRSKAEGKLTVVRVCPVHGPTGFCLEGRGYYRCKRCRSERVSQRRRGSRRS